MWSDLYQGGQIETEIILSYNESEAGEDIRGLVWAGCDEGMKVSTG